MFVLSCLRKDFISFHFISFHFIRGHIHIHIATKNIEKTFKVDDWVLMSTQRQQKRKEERYLYKCLPLYIHNHLELVCVYNLVTQFTQSLGCFMLVFPAIMAIVQSHFIAFLGVQ